VHQNEEQAKPVAFAATAFAFITVMAGTTLPSPLFGLYEQTLHLSPLTVTVLYASYAFGVVLSLLAAVPLAARLGRRATISGALVLCLVSDAAFIASGSAALMLGARVLSGLAAGAMTGTATEALIGFGGPARRARSAALAIVVNMTGLACGTALAGAVADLGYYPLKAPFVVDAGLVAAAAVGLLALPADPTHPRDAHARSLWPYPRAVAPLRHTFARAAVVGGLGFAANGLIPTVAAVFLERFLDIDSHFAAGALISLVFLATAGGQLLTRRAAAHDLLPAAIVGLAAGLAVFAVAIAAENLALFILAATLIGLSTGTAIGAGIAELAERADTTTRHAVITAYFVVLYLLLAVPIIAFGIVLNHATMAATSTAFSALGVVVLLGLLIGPRLRRADRRALPAVATTATATTQAATPADATAAPAGEARVTTT
jgi:predicted MFS family arabinose efflux permease